MAERAIDASCTRKKFKCQMEYTACVYATDNDSFHAHWAINIALCVWKA